MAFLTCHLVALEPMTYFGANLEAGDPFMATPNDAEYFVRHRRAREALSSEQVPFTPPMVVAAETNSGGDETGSTSGAASGGESETSGPAGETGALGTGAQETKKVLSAGLNVAELHEALQARGVEIPANVTLKRELAALLDAQPK